MRKIRVCYIFRQHGLGFSIETLFDNIIKYLPPQIQAQKISLPHHTGTIGRLKNLLFVQKLNSCDLYHVTGDVNYIALTLPGNKTIITVHDIESLFDKNPIKNQLKKLFWLKLPLSKARHITVISDKTYQQIKKIISNPQKITLIPNCIEDSWFEIEKTRKPENNKILVIGTKKNKNLENIIKAVKDLNVQLIIVGKLNESQKRLLKGINYQNFYGVSRQQMKQLYLQSQILLFPSLYEGFGLPIIEAQALGIPVITSNLEPMKSVAANAALLVNPYEPNEIKTAIIQTFNSHSLKQELSKAGYKNANQYRCSKIALKYAQLYQNLLQNESFSI